MNYLSNGTFHTMMSQAGGGVAFYKSPQIWRINHYKFFHIPTDRSGFYTYIKDGADFWCPTNEPTKSKPKEWTSTHGMGYTRFEAAKNGVKAVATYFVGEYENALIWNIKLTSAKDKKLKLFPFVELGMMEFMRELQWQCYNKHQLSCYNIDDVLVYNYAVENQPKPDETPLVYFASNVPVSGFDCDRDEFIGSYRSEENPKNVESGKCTNSTLYGGDPCFCLELDVELKAGEEKEINIFLGTAMTEEEIKKSVAHLREDDFVQKSFDKLCTKWRYKAEPYVYASNIFGPESDKFGLANVSWLTGTACWMYVAVTQYMLGIKADWDGLSVNPCLAPQMLPAKIMREFRGCRYEIKITKSKSIFIPHVDGRQEYKVTIG